MLGAIAGEAHREGDLLQRRRADGQVAHGGLDARRLAGGHEVGRGHAAGAPDARAAVQEDGAGTLLDDLQEAGDLGRRRRLAVVDRQRHVPEPLGRQRSGVDVEARLGAQIDDRGHPGRGERSVAVSGGGRRAPPHLAVDGGEVVDVADVGRGGGRLGAGDLLQDQRRHDDRQVAEDHEQHEADDDSASPHDGSAGRPSDRADRGDSRRDDRGRHFDRTSIGGPPAPAYRRATNVAGRRTGKVRATAARAASPATPASEPIASAFVEPATTPSSTAPASS